MIIIIIMLLFVFVVVDGVETERMIFYNCVDLGSSHKSTRDCDTV